MPCSLSNRALAILVLVLAVLVTLAVLNPTRQQYAEFLEAAMMTALQKMDQREGAHEGQIIRDVLRSQGRKIIDSVVTSRTVRHNYGICTIFTTRAFDVEITVLGLAGWFIPLEREQDLVKKLGQMVLS